MRVRGLREPGLAGPFYRVCCLGTTLALSSLPAAAVACNNSSYLYMSTLHTMAPVQAASFAASARATPKACAHVTTLQATDLKLRRQPQRIYQWLHNSVVQPSTKFHVRARRRGCRAAWQTLNPM